jgi:hypothetical protein
VADFDRARVSETVAAALAGPGGVALVVNVFGAVPGVVRSPARRSMFRSDPELVLIGDWRYEVTRDGRLRAAHVINEIVIADEVLDATAVGPHVARALQQVVDRYGAAVLPHIDAAVDALRSSAGGA